MTDQEVTEAVRDLVNRLSLSVTALSVDEVVALIVQMHPLPDSLEGVVREVTHRSLRKKVEAIAAPILTSVFLDKDRR